MYLLEKPPIRKFWSLVYTILFLLKILVSSGQYLHIWLKDLRNFNFFRFYRPWKLKNPIWQPFLGSFWPIKIRKKENFSNPFIRSVQIFTQGRYKSSFRTFWCKIFLRRYIRAVFGYCDFKFLRVPTVITGILRFSKNHNSG